MLTPAQLATLKAAIAAETDVAFVEYRTNGQTGLMAAFFNVAATPAFYIYRRAYSTMQMRAAVMAASAQLDNLTASKRDSLFWVMSEQLDMTVQTNRDALDNFTGIQQQLKSSLLDGGKRTVTRGEKLYCTGSGSLAAPGIAMFEGDITDRDISDAINLP